MTREELLYFFGDRATFCRPAQPPIHSSQNNSFSGKDFICGISRGNIENGPVEEGVQVCAIVPIWPRTTKWKDGSSSVTVREGGDIPQALPVPTQGALNCWRKNRPSCAELARQFQNEDLWKNPIFDEFDMVGHLRRTRDPAIISWMDQKRLNELPNVDQSFVFDDSEGRDDDLGLREFCRIQPGASEEIVCGYSRETMEQWFAAREFEPADDFWCQNGVCVRGAFKRGYFCAVHQQSVANKVQQFWLCGFDRASDAGRKRVNATSICEGGEFLRKYHGPGGERSTLRCGQRRFRWAESANSARVLADFSARAEVDAWIRVRRDSIRRNNDYGLGRLEGTFWKFMRGAIHRSADLPSAVRLATGAPRIAERKKAVEEKMGLVLSTFANAAKEKSAFLGHRTSMRRFLLGLGLGAETGGPVLKKFLQGIGVAFDLLSRLTLRAYLSGIVGGTIVPEDLRTRLDALHRAGLKSKLDPVIAVVKELLAEEHPADEAWFQEFLVAVNEARDNDGNILTPPEVIIEAFGAFAHVRALDFLRHRALQASKNYVNALIRQGPPAVLSRYEVLDLAAGNPLFCSTDPLQPTQNRFACGKSPLVMPGFLERAADAEGIAAVDLESYRHMAPAAAYNFREQRRAQAKSRYAPKWCYGAGPGKTDDTQKASVSLRPRTGGALALESPWSVTIPPLDPHAIVSDAGWFRCGSYKFSDEVWARALPADIKPPEQFVAPAGDAYKEVSGFIGDLMQWIFSRLADIDGAIKGIVNVDIPFVSDYAKNASSSMQKRWADASAELRAIQTSVDRAESDRVIKLVAWEKSKAQRDPQSTQDAKRAEYDKVVGDKAAAQTALQNGLKTKREELGKVPVDVVTQLEDLVVSKINEKVGELLYPLVKEVVEPPLVWFGNTIIFPIENAVAAVVAAVPFGGGALVMGVHGVFFALRVVIVEAVVTAIIMVVQKFVGMGVRALLGVVLKGVRDNLQAQIADACRKTPDVWSDICPKKVADRAPQDRWLDKAYACGAKPFIGPKTIEQAALAKARLEQRAANLTAKAPVLARRFADHFLARYGHSYDSWMAANASPRRMGTIPQSTIAESIARDVQKHVASIEENVRASAVSFLSPSVYGRR
ncbi:MAG: hypothetical protein HYY84_01460 [Deltaproteobacteria bacterium]|nr:hypothetical protein [Deltaproteobacteria bacterium]